MRRGPRLWVQPLALAVLVLLGVGLRAWQLEWPPLWSDEAESAVNALTVLGTGLPLDHYLGLPIFENTLVRPWPDHPEYEFRDISYSDRGVAVYHGWLPLYAMAGAFRLAGVTPEEARRGPPLADSSPEEMARWTAVPRWPAIAFSALFIYFAFHLGRRVGGPETGWIMGVASASTGLLVYLGRQARYYSPALALAAACGLAIWTAVRRGRPRDFALAGIAVGLLFHTHALSAVVMTVVFALVLPLAPEPRKLPAGVAVASLGAGLLILPWVSWSGLLGHASHIPPARDLLDLADVLVVLPRKAPLLALALGTGLAWWLAARALRHRVGARWTQPMIALEPALYFAASWAVVAFLGFVLLVPAASFFPLRLELTVAVPGLLVLSLLLAALRRTLLPGGGTTASVTVLLVLLAVSGQIRPPVPGSTWEADEAEINRLVRGWSPGPGGRVLATPNTHLILTYYSGVPVQSVSAVRRSWLETHEGPLMIVETPRFLVPPRSEVREILGAHGRDMEASEVRRFENGIVRLVSAEALAREGYRVHPPPRPLDGLEREAAELTRRWTRERIADDLAGTPLGRAVAGYEDWSGVWHHFFFWFVGPEERSGAGLNYGARARSGRTLVLDAGWVVHLCHDGPDPLEVPESRVTDPGAVVEASGLPVHSRGGEDDGR